MKNILIIVLALFTSIAFAQKKTQNVKHVQKKDLVEATYFYADGSVQQVGTFNKEGKLHGTWTSFDTEGNKLAVGNYKNGKKDGKWVFWVNGVTNEISYVDSKITDFVSSNEKNTL